MTDARLIERLSATNAHRAEVLLPAEVWSADSALQEIERRMQMQTHERPTMTKPPSPPTRRRLVLAAGAIVVFIAAFIAAIVFLTSGDGEPDVIEPAPTTVVPSTIPEAAVRSPLEVAEALDAAIVSGDWEAVLALYAGDATYTHIDDGFGFDAFRHGRPVADYTIRTDMPLTSERFNLGPGVWEEPLAGNYPPVDWDGEPGITAFDNLATLAMADYAAGVTDFYSCEQTDPTTVVCEVVLEGHAFWENPPPVSDIFTIEGGLITHQTYDTTVTQPNTDPSGSSRVQYFVWVEQNRPELEQSLFWSSEGVGRLRVDPDTAETHRELIAEWRAQR